jgi:rifampicin phosphotransferase
MKRIVWDKTNIGENYPGVTSPLTYSFIKGAYANVYPSFFKLLGVKDEYLKEKRSVFDNMLGYVGGEVFYNINNWYELVKILPGYKYNKDFFETMLDPVKKKSSEVSSQGIFQGIWENKKVSIKFIYHILFFSPLSKKFNKNFRKLYRNYLLTLKKSGDNFRLISEFENASERFFDLWAITIVNDFRTMIFFGMLAKLANKKLKDPNMFLTSVVDPDNMPRSLLPIKELDKLSQTIKSNGEFKKLFAFDAAVIMKNIDQKKYDKLKVAIDAYLEKYGERSFNELKLEEPKLKDDPEKLIELLKKYVELESLKIENKKLSPRINGKLSFIDSYLLRLLKRKTAQAIYFREYFRLKRGKVFGLARSTFLNLGEVLQKEGEIDNKEDVFYLYKDELFDYLRFHRLETDLKELINVRKCELEKYKAKELNKRIITTGFPNQFKQLKKIPGNGYGLLKGDVTSRGFVKKQKS